MKFDPTRVKHNFPWFNKNALFVCGSNYLYAGACLLSQNGEPDYGLVWDPTAERWQLNVSAESVDGTKLFQIRNNVYSVHDKDIYDIEITCIQNRITIRHAPRNFMFRLVARDFSELDYQFCTTQLNRHLEVHKRVGDSESSGLIESVINYIEYLRHNDGFVFEVDRLNAYMNKNEFLIKGGHLKLGEISIGRHLGVGEQVVLTL